MMHFLQEIDLRLLQSINADWTNPFLDWFMAFVTDFGLWKWPLVIAAGALFVWGGYRERLLIVMTLMLVLVGERITGTIKRLTNRPRPYQQLEDIRHVDLSGVHISKPGPIEKGRSMPSGHTANNVAFAFVASAIYGRWGKLAWILAFLIAYSRIYTGNHFPSDVAVGFFLSLGYSYAMAWAARALWQRIGPKWLAETYRRHPNLFPSGPMLA